MGLLKVYACMGNDLEVRRNSSSGAVFSVLAEEVIAHHGAVYGVAMTEDCRGAKVCRVTEDISPLRGSKYFQAEVGDAFRQVREDLEKGLEVLYSGTGCQVNGLKLFLKKDYPNLLTVDVVCHGAPSPKIWKTYVNYQEQKFGEKLRTMSFRCKDKGWSDYGLKENEHFCKRDQDPFMQMFLRDECLRPSCYQCRAKEMKLSDLTIGDFWGIDLAAPEMDDGMGTSLVITRTEKGQRAFEAIRQQLRWKEVSYEDGVRWNPAEYASVPRPALRDSFFEDLDRLPFPEMIRKYAYVPKTPLLVRVKRKLKRILKRLLGREGRG